MTITREKKETLLQEYKEMLANAQVALVTGYQGLNMGELTALRRQLRDAGIQFRVVKNTLVRMALADLGASMPDDLWREANALAVSKADPAVAAKMLSEYAKGEPRLVIKAGFLGKEFVDAAGINALASLPSREVLLAQVLAGIQSPITGLVTVLSGLTRGLVNVLEARRRQLEKAAA